MRQASTRERGVVLITGLIFLVVLTMIVLTVMRGSTLEERMAANARNRQLALQAAEAVSREAAAALFSCITSICGPSVSPIDPFDNEAFTSACTGGFCNADATKWKTIDWGDTTVTRTFVSSGSHLSGVASQPRYIVEFLGWDDPSYTGKSGGSHATICPKVLYRVTARGVGADSSVVFVENMYRYLPKVC